MIESKEEFNDLINRLKAKEKDNRLGKSLQIKLQAFKEVEGLINKLTIPNVVVPKGTLLCPSCYGSGGTVVYDTYFKCEYCNGIGAK